MAKKYRKIPVVIEAEHVTPELIVANEGKTETYVTNDGRPHTIEWRSDGVYISTLEGVMKADVGDYIITGIQGEKYPCKADIFEKTYEEVAE